MFSQKMKSAQMRRTHTRLLFESVHFFSGIASCHGLSLSMSRVLTMCYIIFRCFCCLKFFSLCNSSCVNMLEMWRCVKSNDSNKKTANKTVEIHFHAYIFIWCVARLCCEEPFLDWLDLKSCVICVVVVAVFFSFFFL